MSSKQFFCLIIFLSLFSCNTDDDQVVEDPIIYPITYELTGYSSGDPHFYLVEESSVSPVSPSESFAAHLNYLKTDFLDEISQDFFFQSFTLNSDTACVITFFNSLTQSLDELGSFYELANGEFTFIDSIGIPSFSLEYDEVSDEMVYCEIIFSNTYWDSFSNSTEYRGFDSNPCFLFPEDDPAAGYRESNMQLEVGDTLGVLDVSRPFVKQ